MTTLKIWGRLNSINVRKVVWTAQELGVPFEHVNAGGAFGIVNTPAYTQRNPNARVPLLEDGYFVLWESNVIVRYLCAKHALGTLYPEALTARFDAERWMDWQQTTLNPAGRDAFWQLIRTAPEARDAALIAKSVAATQPLLALLDAQLSERAYICGEHFTMADIPLACEVHRFWNLPREHSPRPHLARWYNGLQARPATRGVLDQILT